MRMWSVRWPDGRGERRHENPAAGNIENRAWAPVTKNISAAREKALKSFRVTLGLAAAYRFL